MSLHMVMINRNTSSSLLAQHNHQHILFTSWAPCYMCNCQASVRICLSGEKAHVVADDSDPAENCNMTIYDESGMAGDSGEGAL